MIWPPKVTKLSKHVLDHEWHYSDGRRVIALKELNTESGRENVFFSDQHD